MGVSGTLFRHRQAVRPYSEQAPGNSSPPWQQFPVSLNAQERAPASIIIPRTQIRQIVPGLSAVLPAHLLCILDVTVLLTYVPC